VAGSATRLGPVTTSSPPTAFLTLGGYNPRGVLAFWRALVRTGVPFFTVASGPRDPVFKTAYGSTVIHVRQGPDLSVAMFRTVVEKIRVKETNCRLFLCPSSEYLNHFSLRHEAELRALGIELSLGERSVYERLTNKLTFRRLCEKYHLAVPKWTEHPENAPLPYVAKPRKNIVGGKTLYPYLVTCEAERSRFLEAEDPAHYYFEEYLLGGESLYLLAYVSPRLSALFSQRNLLQQGGGKSIVLAVPSSFHETPLAQRVVEVLSLECFRGLIMIEIRAWRNQMVFIEANPRIWGPSQLLLDNNTGLLETFIRRTLGMHVEPPAETLPSKPVPYCWSGGLVGAVRSGLGVKWHAAGPRAVLPVLARAFRHDVYLRHDSWKLFFAELFRNISRRQP